HKESNNKAKTPCETAISIGKKLCERPCRGTLPDRSLPDRYVFEIAIRSYVQWPAVTQEAFVVLLFRDVNGVEIVAVII
ncbi:MAG: hypothetical protein AAFO94_12690, partial [Bacteroidota bacterium]